MQESSNSKIAGFLTAIMCAVSSDFRSTIKFDRVHDLIHAEALRTGQTYDQVFQAFEEDWEGQNNRWSACRHSMQDNLAKANTCDFTDVYLMDVQDFIQRRQTGNTYSRPQWVKDLIDFKEEYPQAAAFLRPYGSTNPDASLEQNFRRLQKISETYGVSLDDLGEILEGVDHKCEWWMDFDEVSNRNNLYYADCEGLQAKIDIVLELMESGVAPPSSYEDVFTITALKKQDLGITSPYEVVDLDIHDIKKYMNTPRFHAHKAAEYPFADTGPSIENRLS